MPISAASIAARPPSLVAPFILTLGTVKYPLPGFVITTLAIEPFGPNDARAVAPDPDSLSISTTGAVI